MSAIRSACPAALQTMEEVEKSSYDGTEDNLDEVEDVGKISGELCDILSPYCTEQALSVIKGVTLFEGFLAWQKLHRKYNPKTMARAIQLMMDVKGPKQVKEIREVETAITAWEMRVRKLESEFGESLTSTMKIAIVTGMMPTSIQDDVYTNVDWQTEYPAVVARIKIWAENKAAMMNGPVPMEISEVQWEEYNDEWEDAEVQAVGPNAQCHRCSGWRHMARDCATEPKCKGKSLDYKGEKAHDYLSKGKGYENKGKGFDIKGKGKSRKGDDHKGKGRGYQGVCWNCGKVGHKANECASQRPAYAVEEEIVEEADVGGVCMVGKFEVETANMKLKQVEVPPGLDLAWS